MAQQESVLSTKSTEFKAIESKSLVRQLLLCMRPHQWVKNLFIFAPLIFGRKLTDPTALGDAALATISFCLMSSAVYLFNDVIDAAEDREHPEKRFRPVASGSLPAPVALVTSLVLVTLGLLVGKQLGLTFFLIATAYLGLTISYCVSLKGAMILDCMIIAVGFVLRVVGGAAAVGIESTHWLIGCAFLLALYLAFAKRRQELLMLSEGAAEHRPVLAQYSVSYLDQVCNILIAATVVCYALYTVAPETVARFSTDKLIYGTVFVIYGLLRYMALTRDPTKGGNPSKMLLHDWPVRLTVLGWGAYNVLVIYYDSLVGLWWRS